MNASEHTLAVNDKADIKANRKTRRARRARRKQIVDRLPTAAAFLADVADMMRRYSKTDSEEDRNERHIADTLDAFIGDLLAGTRPAYPPPPASAQFTPQTTEQPVVGLTSPQTCGEGNQCHIKREATKGVPGLDISGKPEAARGGGHDPFSAQPEPHARAS